MYKYEACTIREADFSDFMGSMCSEYKTVEVLSSTIIPMGSMQENGQRLITSHVSVVLKLGK